MRCSKHNTLTEHKRQTASKQSNHATWSDGRTLPPPKWKLPHPKSNNIVKTQNSNQNLKAACEERNKLKIMKYKNYFSEFVTDGDDIEVVEIYDN